MELRPQFPPRIFLGWISWFYYISFWWPGDRVLILLEWILSFVFCVILVACLNAAELITMIAAVINRRHAKNSKKNEAEQRSPKR